jgi:hypothetical protein
MIILDGSSTFKRCAVSSLHRKIELSDPDALLPPLEGIRSDVRVRVLTTSGAFGQPVAALLRYTSRVFI